MFSCGLLLQWAIKTQVKPPADIGNHSQLSCLGQLVYLLLKLFGFLIFWLLNEPNGGYSRMRNAHNIFTTSTIKHFNHVYVVQLMYNLFLTGIKLLSFAHLTLHYNHLLTWRYIAIICSCGVTLQSFAHLYQMNTWTETRYATSIITINIIMSNQWQTLIINKCSSVNHWIHNLSPGAQSHPMW